MNEKDTKESAQPADGEEKLSTVEQENKEEESPQCRAEPRSIRRRQPF